MKDDRFESFSSLIGNTMKYLNRIKTNKMSVYGLGSAHTICLRHLYEQPQGLTKMELAKLCEVDKAQISRVTGELVQKGYITGSDGKAYNRKLTLTDKGKNITEEINGLVIRINSFVSSEIPDADIRIFYRTLEKICENLKIAGEQC